jgi:hypothetical protein
VTDINVVKFKGTGKMMGKHLFRVLCQSDFQD